MWFSINLVQHSITLSHLPSPGSTPNRFRRHRKEAASVRPNTLSSFTRFTISVSYSCRASFVLPTSFVRTCVCVCVCVCACFDYCLRVRGSRHTRLIVITQVVQGEVPSNVWTQLAVTPVLPGRRQELHPFLWVPLLFNHMTYRGGHARTHTHTRTRTHAPTQTH